MTEPKAAPSRVALFATCLVETMRPSVGFATLKLLKAAGVEVVVPPGQSCCGQPQYNSGDRKGAKRLAKRVIAEFEPYEAVVIPSGSCAGMVSVHYPHLFEDEPQWARRAEALAAKTYELTQFLVDVLGVSAVPGRHPGAVAYHDSCSSRREMHVHAQPRALLAAAGAEVRDVENAEDCCGFGGTFCVKMADVSGAMVDAKAQAAIATGADTLLAGDMGCLLNIAGRLKRLGSPIAVRHVAEVLAGEPAAPAIGETRK